MSRLSVSSLRRQSVAILIGLGLTLLVAAGGLTWWVFGGAGRSGGPGGDAQTLAAYPMLLADIEPPDGAILRGSDAWIRWSPPAPSKGTVLWRAEGERDFRTVEAEGGDPLLAQLISLQPGTRYEYIVESRAGERVERSGLRTFTVQGGLAFEHDLVVESIKRDYDQTVVQTLRNSSQETVTVGGRALTHYEDLPADIVGPGCVDDPVVLAHAITLPLR